MAIYTERTLRKRAHKIGYKVMKRPLHYNGKVLLDANGDRQYGYMVADDAGFLVSGSYNPSDNSEPEWEMYEVENFLRDQYKERGMVW